jgi:hypothetical protein
MSWPRGKGAKILDRFVFTHGDCHGNNIMISGDFRNAVFIDIADVHIDDYLEDFAQLTAHLCFSANLERMTDTELVDSLVQYPDISKAENLDFLYRERWSGLDILWENILENILDFAEQISDYRAMLRFCVLLGRRLIFIASKSPSNIKAYILYIQGMLLLQSALERMKHFKSADYNQITIPPGDWMEIPISK